MRGILEILVIIHKSPGIIPAGAGHFTLAFSILRSAADHPRRCGAFLSGLILDAAAAGSSPQVRGISKPCPIKPREPGIIPAGAGHFRYRYRKAPLNPDHPRRCGAFITVKKLPREVGGSSPQVRGISITAGNLDVNEGIIPAGAGHLRPPFFSPSLGSDHPRRCGAFLAATAFDGVIGGSSPQVRGI